MFVLDEYASRVALVEQSASADRIWAVVNSDGGPYFICCWHRPPHPRHIESVASLETEYNKHKNGAVEVIILGVVNDGS